MAGLWAGTQNALAGGGSFITLPALILSGLDPRAANISSTVALFPAQVAAGFSGRASVSGTPAVGFGWLMLLALVGGAAGALLLLVTPETVFRALVPWLVLVATGLFAWRQFGGGAAAGTLGRGGTIAAQAVTGIYGGYFGGGNGILMLAVLTGAGMAIRRAGATKNALVAVANGAALLVFVTSPEIDWHRVGLVGAGAIGGGLVGAWALKRVPERAIGLAVIAIGVALSIGLFTRGV